MGRRKRRRSGCRRVGEGGEAASVEVDFEVEGCGGGGEEVEPGGAAATVGGGAVSVVDAEVDDACGIWCCLRGGRGGGAEKERKREVSGEKEEVEKRRGLTCRHRSFEGGGRRREEAELFLAIIETFSALNSIAFPSRAS